MIAAAKHARTAASGHAKNRPNLQRTFGTSSDPVLEDCLLSATALCGELATGDLATLAKAGGFSPSWASEIRRNGGRGGFLHKTTVLAYRLAGAGRANSAWAILAHLKATLKAGMMPTSDADLVQRFWDLLDAEAEAEGRENLEQARYARTGDLEALKRATLAEAAIQEELGAVIQELQRRRIDPLAAQE